MVHPIKPVFTTFISVLIVLLFSVSGKTAEFTIDKDHSHAGFQVRHMVTKLQGEFKEFEGTFLFDEKTPDRSVGKFTIQASSINTNHVKRDTHLRSADFFDVEKFSSLTFESKKIVASGDKSFLLTGDLTIHGVTHSATFSVEYLGSEKSPWGDVRAGFTATGKINRKDYGIVWNKVLDSGGLLIGEDVDILIQVEAVEKQLKK
jgi:polyisoprenoid-binding protein YceI